MAKVYVEKEQVAHILVKNTLGRALEQGEFAVIGSLCGVADTGAADGEPVSLHVEGMIEIQAGIDDLTGAIANYTPGKSMYFNGSTGKFADAASAGFVKVGQITDSSGTDTVRFTKFSDIIQMPDVPEASNTLPEMDGTAAAGNELEFARGDHVHPTADSLNLTDTTDSTSITTGAVKVAGGVGIVKQLWVGGKFNGVTGEFTGILNVPTPAMP